MRSVNRIRKVFKNGIIATLLTIKNLILFRVYKLHFYIVNLDFIEKKRLILGENIILQQKVYLDGKGKISIGNNVAFGVRNGGRWRKGYVEIQARDKSSEVIVRDNVHTNNNLFICALGKVEICEKCMIGKDVEVMDFDGHEINPNTRNDSNGKQEDILIKENVWIGNNSTILRGTIIGKNSIVASRAVVKGIFPDNVIIAGIPARIIGKC